MPARTRVQLAQQQQLAAHQAARTAALEAAIAANSVKAAHDAHLFGRVLEERVTLSSEHFQGRLAVQVRGGVVSSICLPGEGRLAVQVSSCVSCGALCG